MSQNSSQYQSIIIIFNYRFRDCQIDRIHNIFSQNVSPDAHAVLRNAVIDYGIMSYAI
jgi:hypothetical protein